MAQCLRLPFFFLHRCCRCVYYIGSSSCVSWNFQYRVQPCFFLFNTTILFLFFLLHPPLHFWPCARLQLLLLSHLIFFFSLLSSVRWWKHCCRPTGTRQKNMEELLPSTIFSFSFIFFLSFINHTCIVITPTLSSSFSFSWEICISCAFKFD